MELPKIYIAHPYGNVNGIPATKDRTALNVQSAKYIGLVVLEGGGWPINPLANTAQFNYLSGFADWETMMQGTAQMLSDCDAAYFCPGHTGSTGCMQEKTQCHREGIPVFTDMEKLIQYIKDIKGGVVTSRRES